MTQLRRVCDVYDAIDSDDALTRSWTIDWKEGQMRVCVITQSMKVCGQDAGIERRLEDDGTRVDRKES